MRTPLQVQRWVLLLCAAQISFSVVLGPLFPPEPGYLADTRESSAEFEEHFKVPVSEMEKRYFSELSNSAYSDSYAYIDIAMGHPSKPPYSLRPLYPRLVGSIARLHADPEIDRLGFLKSLDTIVTVLNMVMLTVGAAILFVALRRSTRNVLVPAALSALFLANIGTIQTSGFFMLDVPSYFVAALIVLGVSFNSLVLASAAVCLGIAVKEVLVVYVALLAFLLLDAQRVKSVRSWLLVLAPLVIFVGIRLVSGVDPLSMQYGWNISRGEVKSLYLTRHLSEPSRFLFRITAALGAPLLLAAAMFRRSTDRLRWAVLAVVASTIVANLLLASRVSRVVFVAYPALALLIARLTDGRETDGVEKPVPVAS